ncbi:hypothetical protein C1H46_023530 [Malus baccata]|uniref:Elongation factor EFG domain-containing protein n=1 Tax=Malus baccata TaxID=106549 RepID=A0A540LWR3_MALBA|nr:hypothetical protein C1H46_023530 [Malus baccata]
MTSFKAGLKSMEKQKCILGSSATNANVGRRALADVSNVKGNSSRIVGVGTGVKTLNISSRIAFLGKGWESPSQAISKLQTSKRAIKDLKASSENQSGKNYLKGYGTWPFASRSSQALSVEAESLESSVVSGFQVATAAGPLCDEPMRGLAFIIEAKIEPLTAQSDEGEACHHQPEQCGIFRGQVMTAIKDACREAVLQKKPRLVEAMYFCELNTSTENLGSMYAVLGRRRARVLKEEMQEGSPLFTVHAYVPVSERVGFADEIRRWTADAASALLVLSHWEALPEDPFFVPKTEELEEFGDGSSVLPNTARKLINAVRRKRGIPVEEKVVQHATKQRTLTRKV